MADEYYRLRYIPPTLSEIQKLRATENMVIYLGIRADRAADAARARAPVKTGDYRAGIQGQSGFADNIAIGRVVAKDFKSGWIEFGTRKWPAHATLRGGAEASGLHVVGGGKLRWRPKKDGGWY